VAVRRSEVSADSSLAHAARRRSYTSGSSFRFLKHISENCFKYIRDKCVPVNPNLLHTPRKMIEEFEENILGKIFGRNSCDKDSVCLHRF
jgi:hypothetical protein